MQHKITSALHFDLKSFLKSPNLALNSVRFILLIVPLAIGFSQDFVQLFYLAVSNQEVQYVFLVPFFFAYFLYKKRRAFSIPRKASFLHDVIGACLSLLAISTYIWGSYSVYPLQVHLLSLPMLLVGIILILYGPQALRILIFPTILLLFLSPLPLIILDSYGGVLIQSVANSVALVVRPFLPIQANLNPIVTLTSITATGEAVEFTIGEACSGIYSLIAFVFFALVLGYVATGSSARKLIFGSFALLTAYILNIMRVLVMVILGYFFGLGLATEAFHLFGGMVFILFGAAILLLIGDKLLKLSFTRRKTSNNCTSCIQSDNVCTCCRRIIRFQKTSLNWKRLSIILIFLTICTSLIIQASAVNYNIVTNTAEKAFDFDPSTGNLGAFSNITGYRTVFRGRERVAETRLNLQFVGDYFLYGNNSSTTVVAIFEVSDLQSKFHTWEGCLHYQAYPIKIEEKYLKTLYNKNNNFVYGELFITDIPTQHHKLILLYWFDTLNLQTNGIINTLNVKVSLLKYLDKMQNQTTTEQIEYATTELLTIGQELEATWSQYKNPQIGFAVDIHKNNSAFTIAVIAPLVLATALLLTKFLLERARARKKIRQLPEDDVIILNQLKDKNSIRKNDKSSVKILTEKIEEFRQRGIIREKISIKNDELYQNWVHY